MKLDVKKEILDAASQCDHNYICQSVGGKPYCKISDTVNAMVFFTEGKHQLGCNYQHPFGSSFMCTCPVRQEIYLKHKI